MRFALKIVTVFLAGILAGSFFVGWKSGEAFYRFKTDSRTVPPECAIHYWRHMLEENPAMTTVEEAGAVRKVVWLRFHDELQRMKWTWDAELDWVDDEGAIASPGKGGSP